MANLLSKKRALIVGIASMHSLAYGIAKAMRQAGADIAISYHPQLKPHRIKSLATSLNASFFHACDLTQDQDIQSLFMALSKHWKTFDIIVHSVATVPLLHLNDHYLISTTREGFHVAHDVSSYSFTALAKHAKSMLCPKGALLTLTYLGSQRVIPHYNVMGIAKASLEASLRYIAHELGPLDIRVNAMKNRLSCSLI